MTERRLDDWFKSYMEFTAYNESPDIFHFWSGVSAVAAALRRKVWFDQFYFKWYPNFYIILVGPSGVTAKSVTAGNATKILREVDGVYFGPNTLTWQALLPEMVAAQEMVGDTLMSCLTFAASELGVLLDPQDRRMIDILTDLWDGNDGSWEKATKGDGKETIVNPWLNIVACTTPTWLSENLPRTAIGGGFTSRCVWVYAGRKRRLVAYPGDGIPEHLGHLRESLIHDLQIIAAISGEYTLTDEAREWGTEWYKDIQENPPEVSLSGMFEGYISRKQGHVHKLAIALTAAKTDCLVIEQEELSTAATIMAGVEADMGNIFHYAGRSSDAVSIDDLMRVVQNHKKISKSALYRLLFSRNAMPAGDFDNAIASAIKAGAIHEIVKDSQVMIYYNEDYSSEV